MKYFSFPNDATVLIFIIACVAKALADNSRFPSSSAKFVKTFICAAPPIARNGTKANISSVNFQLKYKATPTAVTPITNTCVNEFKRALVAYKSKTNKNSII